MASLEELNEAIGENLRARGVTDAVKARLRAEVFAVLEGEGTVAAPQPDNETLVINELIREYLAFNGYKHALSVFIPESGQPKAEEDTLPRSVVAQDLGLDASANFREDLGRPLPLLYQLVDSARRAAVSHSGGGPRK